MADLRLALEGAFDLAAGPRGPADGVPESETSPRMQRPLPLALGAVALVAVGAVLPWGGSGAVEEPGEVVRFSIVPSDGVELDFSSFRRDLAITPDGRRV